MPVNVKGGQSNVVTAINTVGIAAAGITALNTAIIYLIDSVIKSYVPGRTINGFSQFVAGKGYYIQAIVDMDLSANLAPPFPAGSGNVILAEDDTPIGGE